MWCDRCGYRAYVHITLDTGGELSWCAHHYREHADALAAYVVHEVDQREELTAANAQG